MLRSFMALVFGWYLIVGHQIARYAEASSKSQCSGHSTAHDRWPNLTHSFFMIAWPIGAPVSAMTNLLSPEQLICDRFDP